MNEISEFQRKRAVNQIWNAAKDYAFSPDFKAYDRDGQADVYWNSIAGATRRHYEYDKLQKLFSAFQQYEDADLYEGLLWLGLENAVFQKECRDRPALSRLRLRYAQQFVDGFRGHVPDDFHLYDCLAFAHFLRVLGQDPVISRYDRKLLDELEFSPELSTDQIVEQTKRLFLQWFQINTEEKRKERHLLDLSLIHKRRIRAQPHLRKFGIGLADRNWTTPDGTIPEEEQLMDLKSTMSAEELREFISGKYGLSIFSSQQAAELERNLCVGNHQNCHLHFTRGQAAPDVIRNGFEALQKQKEAAQIERNRTYYREHLARNRIMIERLSSKIQNSVLLYLHPTQVKSNSGKLSGSLVWRAVTLEDEKVFTRSEQGNMGDLSVDILLDASTSQEHRQESISSQAVMIAEALNRCAIPCRVMSFCSMTGYTILRIFRDYQEIRGNDRIFEYVSNGCNRDGLAIRAVTNLMEKSSCEHRLLIILSDAKPHDIISVWDKKAGERVLYEHDVGVTDTAYEVRRARAEGIAVICVFTGDDEDLSSAKLIYGRDFARIQSIDKLADTVGMLIQNQIRNL